MFEFMRKIVTIMRPIRVCKLTSNKWNMVLALHNGKSFYFPIALWRGHFVYKLHTCRVVFCLSICGFCATFPFQYFSLEVTDVSKVYAKTVM
jgi:hypothetical protein